jgi:hypothetical protein
VLASQYFSIFLHIAASAELAGAPQHDWLEAWRP